MKIRSNQGQATVLTVVFLVVLLAMAALVLDVGSWYRAKRAAQSTADAAALAGAQALPSTGNASTLAQQYANKNGGLGTGAVDFSCRPRACITANDTITVTVHRTAPGFFAKIFGMRSVNVGATATARSEAVSQARYVAPITVHYKHPLLNCTGGGNNITCNPTFGVQTTLDLEDLHAPGNGSGSGAFGLINLDQNSGGNVGAGTLADWLANGFPDYLGLGQYNSAPSANFNNSQFLASLNAVLGQQVLFPVYRVLKGPGSNALYDIIGWVGFVITSYDTSGSTGTITGHFTTYIADGVQVTSCGCADLGAHKVELVN